MAQVVGVTTAQNSVGAREDLANTITNIQPDVTPLYSMARKTKATAINHEWQTDTYDTASVNAHPEGESIVVSSASPTVRLGNICQISEKDYSVSGTMDALNLAGRESELVRLRMKKGLELRRDIEVILHANQAKATDTGGSVRRMGGLPTWITNNCSASGILGNGNGDGSSVVSASTLTSTLSYELLSSALQMAYEDGGEPNVLELPPALKRKFSTIQYATSTPNTADVRFNADGKNKVVAVGTVDKWLSDFGTLDVIPNRLLGTQADTFIKQAAFLLDSSHIAVATLRAFEVNRLAKTGDATSEFIVWEGTLAPDAPTAHAAVYRQT
jgi:hypothetical protein